MLTVKGLTLKYPASTALALACAAVKLSWEATKQKDKRKAAKYMTACYKYLEVFGGSVELLGASGDAQRVAIETLCSDPMSRAEAHDAVAKHYGHLGLPPWGWIVHPLLCEFPYQPVSVNLKEQT